MSEIRRDEIIYEEGWRDITDEEPEEDAQPPADQEKPQQPIEKTEKQRPLLIVLQLTLSMIAALILFLLKSMDSGAYHDFMRYYHDEMSKPVVSQQVFDAIDWNALFGADSVSVSATPDELTRR